jgi:hypothetical protein
MRLRPERILEDTTIILKDGTEFRTRYESKWHIVTCDLCLIGIKEQFTMQARADFKLPDSDNLPLGVSEDCLEPYDEIEEFIGKRRRSETQSSSKPPYKKHHF